MEALAGNTFYFDFEVAVLEFLQKIFGESAVNIVSLFSAFGEEIVLILIMGFFYWGCDKKLGRYIAKCILLGIVINPMIKNIFLRRRPYFDNPQIKCLRPLDKSADLYDIAAQGYSFPSAHSANGVTAYGAIAKYKKNKIFTAIAVIVPLLVGLSRMTVGVHYPTDVAFGWLMGLAIVLIVDIAEKKIPEEKKWIADIILFAVCCVGFFYCKTDDYYTCVGLFGGFLLAQEFDRRVVNFRSTQKPLRVILRVIGGVVVFYAFTVLLKLPFSKEFLASGTFPAFLVRFFRYFVAAFMSLGVYPMLYAKCDKFWKEEA